MARRTELFPVLLGLLEDVAGIVFIEIVPLDRNRNSRLWIPVDVMVCAMAAENISKGF